MPAKFHALKTWLVCLTATTMIVLAISACSGNFSDQAKPVTFMAGYKPQANLPFVAAYVAKAKGYFTEQKLDVTIRHASSGEHTQLLLSGDVQFTTADAESVIKKRANPGIPIRAIALFGQRGQQGYIALESSGIRTPQDWQGKTFGYKGSQPPSYLAILEATGTDRSKIEEVRVGYDPRILSEGQVDVLAVFKSNEPNILQNLGFPVTLFDPENYGVPTMGLTYIAHKDYLNDEKKTVKRFLKATIKGWEFALSNIEETLDIIMTFAPQANREHQRFMLQQELADAQSPLTQQHGLGWMTEEQWHELYNQLLIHQALHEPFNYTTTFDPTFLEEIYDHGRLRWP